MNRTCIAILVALMPLLSTSFSSATARELWIEHVTVVSAERPRHQKNITVVVRDETIASVTASSSSRGPGKDVVVIDGTGLFLSPGLIDSHVHTNELSGIVSPMEERFPVVARALRQQLPRSYLYFGFTTLVDTISTPAHLREWSAHPLHPDLYFCGATPIPGGYPPTYRTQEEQARTFPYMLTDEHDTAAVVEKMKTDGAICVKAFYERGFGEVNVWPVPRLETIRALVKAAHAANLPVLMHANSTDGQGFALEAGVDIVAHGLWHWNGEPQATQLTPRTKAILDRVLKAGTGWQATLRVLAGDRDAFDPEFLANPRVAAVVPPAAIEWYRSVEGQWYRNANAPVYLSKAVLDSGDLAKQWAFIRSPEAPLIGPAIERGASAASYMAAHGGRFLFASDTPGSPAFTNQPGLNGWLEMQLLLDAGLTPAQIFRAATLANAEALGLTREIGTVQVGKRANLLLTRQDPTQSTEAYDDIVKVILRGRVIERDELAAPR